MKIMRIIAAIVFLFLLPLPAALCLADESAVVGVGEQGPPFTYVPQNGVIPDEATAAQVGEAILKAAYGKDLIEKEEPFKATLDKDDVWHVRGTLPTGLIGGTGEIYLSKSNWRVTRLLHSQ